MADAKNTNVFVKRNAKTENFKRPDHPDFRTADEHKKAKFTGIRRNEMGLRWEFWILGEIKKEVTFQEVARDPKALAKAHVELFRMQPDPDLFKGN